MTYAQRPLSDGPGNFVTDEHLPERLQPDLLSATYAARREISRRVDEIGLSAANNAWFDKSRRGLFVHYVYGGTGASVRSVQRDGTTPATLDDVATGLDVPRLASDCKAFGVDYLVFTAWHYAMYALYPSAVMNATLPGHASTRDVIADLIAALKPLGIKLVLYIHPLDGADLTTGEQATTGWNDSTGNYAIWANFVNSLITECGNRYGTDLDGFWVDMVQDVAFPTKIFDRARFRRSLKAGNPNRILIANQGDSDAAMTDLLYNSVVEHKTREFGAAGATTTLTGNQNSAALRLGNDWMSRSSESSGFDNGRSSSDLFRYLVLNAGCNRYGGGMLYAAGPYIGSAASSMWEPGVEADFLAIEAKVAPVRESLHDVIPSAAFPTANTVTLATLGTPGFVATRSASKDVDYIHVLTPPSSGSTVSVPTPADGTEFYGGVNFRTGHAVTVTPTSTGYDLALTGGDTWHAEDTVISLFRVLNRSARQWVGAGAFGSANGATYSSQAVSGRYAAWSLSPTTNMQVEATFSVPRDWNTFRIALLMAQPGGATGTGDAVLTIVQASVVPGGATNVDGASYSSSWTMPGDTVTLASMSPFAPIANKPDSIHHIRIARNATTGGDTGPTLAVLGLMAHRVS